jgi:hypothetical protein
MNRLQQLAGIDEIKIKNVGPSADMPRKLYLAFHEAIDYFDLEDSMDWNNFEIQQDEDGIYDSYSLIDFLNTYLPEGELKKGPITNETLILAAREYNNEEGEEYEIEYNNLLRSAQKAGIL